MILIDGKHIPEAAEVLEALNFARLLRHYY